MQSGTGGEDHGGVLLSEVEQTWASPIIAMPPPIIPNTIAWLLAEHAVGRRNHVFIGARFTAICRFTLSTDSLVKSTTGVSCSSR
jgi:hypothetical protein